MRPTIAKTENMLMQPLTLAKIVPKTVLCVMLRFARNVMIRFMSTIKEYVKNVILLVRLAPVSSTVIKSAKMVSGLISPTSSAQVVQMVARIVKIQILASIVRPDSH